MKLWDSLTTCLILLSAVHASPLLQNRRQQPPSSRRRGRAAEGPLELPPVQTRLSATSPGISSTEPAGREQRFAGGDQDSMEELLPSDFEDVVDFIKVTISRIRRSTAPAASSSTSSSTTIAITTPSTPREDLSSRTRRRRERKKGASQESSKGGKRGGARGGDTGRRTRGGGGGGRGQGCVLKQIHLNVSDLGLGYRSSEEMIFRYCSGPCRKSETNYDKILYNLVHNRKLPAKDTPPQACCRPTAFDDDLSFLDDSLVYHTVRKHSARKCGCV
ncbi:glial cell line-derived neurotrophic factor-like [Stegastes partitus]|uniref:Glial cell line-derived neurotrophic factor n=1 Tax=Stegastes partitus TaxID=144197 RepID=A0A9Y4K4E8_9TELE|nr:PREDICTED: glial cell line-derived neurotrophic factor-like [Stegastes partitus]